MIKKHMNVVAAVVKRDDKYLCLQRTRSEYEYTTERWEFPGGQVKKGESDHEALMREIKEELDWDVFVGKQLGSVDFDYPDFSITLTAYLCLAENDDYKLLEHLNDRWLTREELPQLNWTDADRELLAYV